VCLASTRRPSARPWPTAWPRRPVGDALPRRDARIREYAEAKEKGQSYSSFAFELARTLVFPEMKEALSKRFGGRIRTFVSGGAPLEQRIAILFDLVGLDILEGYGSPRRSGDSVNLPGQTSRYGRRLLPASR